MSRLAADANAQRRFMTMLLGVFAGAALLLAAVGMYGVIAYGVSQRSREVGVRIAIGATKGRVLRLVLREGVILAGVGVLGGAIAALGLTRVIRALLFQTTPTDLVTIALAAAVLTAVALVASGIPALRASRQDPTIAMRGE